MNAPQELKAGLDQLLIQLFWEPSQPRMSGAERNHFPQELSGISGEILTNAKNRFFSGFWPFPQTLQHLSLRCRPEAWVQCISLGL